LSDEALSGQVLVSQRVQAELETIAEMEPVGPLTLKGFSRPVTVFNVVGLKEVAV
jgi:adenylate cyclase